MDGLEDLHLTGVETMLGKQYGVEGIVRRKCDGGHGFDWKYPIGMNISDRIS